MQPDHLQSVIFQRPTAENPSDEYLSVEYRGLGPPLRPDAARQRLDGFLARAFPFKSRREWKDVCCQGHLLVNGRPARASYRLKGGEHLAVYHPLGSEPAVDDGIALIAEEAGVLAVYKPGNLPMHESGLYRRRTFSALLAERFGAEWIPVHRLDRETSGVVLCAATSSLRKQLSLQFESRQVDKRYLAVVQGQASWDELNVDQPLLLEQNDRCPRFVVATGGTPSVTEFKVLGRPPGASLIEARPRTGRPNQIRAHAAWTGHALLGDKIYHPDPRVYEAYHRLGDVEDVRRLAGFHRHALHAASVRLRHPETGRDFCASVDLPPDMECLWRADVSCEQRG